MTSATVFAAVAGAAGILAPTPAGAEDAAFTVANYPVEARAEDAVKAKEKALADGQRAAFRSLLKRLVPVTAYDRLKRLNDVKASDLIEGVAVRSERNSSTEYIASLDFSFQPEAVRGLLRRESVPFIDKLAPPVVVVPVLRDGATGKATSDRAWTKAWSDLDLEHTITPVKVAALKPVIHSDTLRMAAQGDRSVGRILSSEYGSDTVVLALAEYDAGAQKLLVVLSGDDSVGPLFLKRSYPVSGGDLRYAEELAAVIGLGVLEGRWKATRAAARGGVDVLAGPGAVVRVQVEFSSLSQWNDMRRQLLETQGVEDLEVEAVSARSAELSLRYPGGGEQLAEALAAQGLTLLNIGGKWRLTSRF